MLSSANSSNWLLKSLNEDAAQPRQDVHLLALLRHFRGVRRGGGRMGGEFCFWCALYASRDQ